jgi:amino acid adenylation domain-containing protein
VSIFGVLKAGGAYLPIDPLYPAARVAYLLDDARPRLLLAHRPLPPPLSSGVAMEVVWLSAEGDPEEQDPVDAAAPGAASARSSDDDLAYVIYTSGSTGAPKGVMVTHKSACNMALGQIRAFNVRDRDRVLQLASLSFDVSLSEILMALFTGATLVMARRQALLPGPELVRLLRDNRITNVSMTASTLAALPWGELPALETLIVGGEVCAPEVVARWAAGRSLFNAYGPTETTVCATRARWRDGQRTSIIGRPLENVTVYVLDEALELAPIGLSGELYIGGSGVGGGYLRRPGLTAERFIPDPFGAAAGERLYRTGDRARFLPDGSLEYLGRLDDQLKIRGFRVEPGEIEANLTAHPLVREALVIGRDDGPQGERLYAFVVPAAAAALGDELRSYLRQRLPEHMVPQVIVALDALPRTPSGKLQKDALPAPTAARPPDDGAAPRSPIEELVAAVWAEILGVDDVGVGDDFFDRGGHSLLATQMMSRLRKAFGVDLPLRAVFEAPTVAALASLVEATLREGAPPQALPIARVPRDGELALSSGQERLWLMHRLEPESPLYNIFSAVRLEGRLVRGALERSLRAMTRRHEVLRTTFAEVDGQPLPVIHEEVEIHVPLIDLGGLPPEMRDEAVSAASVAEAARPFDLSRGPLLRAELLRLGDDDHVLLLTLHHIIADGWAMGVLVREVAALYSALTAGAEPSLPELPIQFVDYAGWQRKRLDGEALERELAYWRRQLEGAPPSLDLPLDRPRPPSLTFRGASLSFEIQGALARALTALSRREGVTLYMTLLSALAILLGRHAGQSDVVVGTSIANRTRPETEGLIGFFINNLVLRVDLSEGPTFRALLARTREICLGAYAHQDVPFERLVTELHPRRDPSRAPLFQVLFVLQNAPMPPLELPGLRLSVREQPNETAKFDLTLFVAATSRGLAGAWSYKTDLFDASTIARLDGQFLNLLRDAVEDPDRPIADLSLITPAEQRALISGFNDDLEGVEDGG